MDFWRELLEGQQAQVGGSGVQIPLPAVSLPLPLGPTALIGSSTYHYALPDHVHTHGDQLGGTLHAILTSSAAGFAPSFGAAPAGYVLTVSGGTIGWAPQQGTTYTAGTGLQLIGTVFSMAAGAALANLGYTPAHSGANSDITSLSALSTPLSIGQGGTGSSTKNFVDLSTNQSAGGNKTWSGDSLFSGNVILAASTDSTLTGTNQIIPSHPSPYLRVTNAGLISLGGISNTGVVPGHIVWLENDTGHSLTISNRSGSVPVGQQFLNPFQEDTTLPAESLVSFVYDAESNGWLSASLGFINLAGNGVGGILPIVHGGTGSSSQNFVDISTTQAAIGGAKTWTGKNIFKNIEFTADNNVVVDSGAAFEFKRGAGFVLDGVGADIIAWYLGGYSPTGSPSSIIWTMAAATYAMKGLTVSLDSTSAFNINCLTTVSNNDLTVSNGHFNLTNTTVMGVSSAGTWLSFQGGPYGDFNIHGATTGAMQTFRTAAAGDTVVFPMNASFPSASTLSPSGTTQTINFMTGSTQTVSLAAASGNVTLTINNAAPGGRYKLVFIQGATPRTLVWPTVTWLDGQPPLLSTVNGGTDIIDIYADATRLYGTHSGGRLGAFNPYAFASLPSATSNPDILAILTDKNKGLVYSNGSAWQNVSTAWQIYRLEDFGGIPNDSTSGARTANNAAWEAMMLSMALLTDFTGAYRVQFAAANYYFAAEIHCKHILHIEGSYSGLEKYNGTTLWFPPGGSGLWVDYVYPAFTGYNGSGSHFSNFTVKHDQNLASWAATTVYATGAAVKPSGLRGWGGYVFVNLGSSGTSGGTEPVWPEDISALTYTDGQTVSDGTITWTAKRNALINIRGMMTAEKVFADSGYGDGWWIYSDAFDHILADLVTLFHCGATNNMSCGLLNSGGDNTSAGAIYQFEALSNGTWGVRDQSFLGNTYHGLDCSYNGINRGASTDFWAPTTVFALNYEVSPTVPNGYTYRSSGGTSSGSQPTWPTTVGQTVSDGTITWTCYRKFKGGAAYFTQFCSVFGFYAEGGQLPIHNEGLIIAEILGTGLDTSSQGFTLTNNICQTNMQFNDTTYGGNLRLGRGADGVMQVSPTSGPALPFGLKYGYGRTGWWNWNYGNLSSPYADAYAFSTVDAAEGYGQFWTPNGIFLGLNGVAPGAKINGALSAPTSGAHVLAEVVFNTAPRSSEYPIAWRCTVAGTPGTWVPVYGTQPWGPALLTEGGSTYEHFVADDIITGSFATATSRVGGITLASLNGVTNTTAPGGRYHQAFRFNANAYDYAYTAFGTATGITPGVGLSVEAVVTFDSFDSAYLYVLNGSPTAIHFQLNTNGSLSANVTNTASGTYLSCATGAGVLSLSTWYLLTCVLDDAAGTLNIYVNGVLKATGGSPTGSIALNASTEEWSVYSIGGNFTELMRTNAAFSASTVASRCQAFFNTYYPTSPFTVTAAQTSNYTILFTDQNTTFTNTGASGEVDFTLPPATVNLNYEFSVEVEFLMKIIAAGTDVIRLGVDVSTAGGNLSSTTVGSTVRLRCTKTGVWSAFGPAGNWGVA
jgi:hypothetical protein